MENCWNVDPSFIIILLLMLVWVIIFVSTPRGEDQDRVM
mgnify:CR=1 FL=1